MILPAFDPAVFDANDFATTWHYAPGATVAIPATAATIHVVTITADPAFAVSADTEPTITVADEAA
jgi:hypothetical protein